MRSILKKTRGFTLIELLVVLLIMTFITLAFINNQSKFDSGTIMRALAYQVALSVRQTQVYGTSVIQNGQGATTFGPVFGLSFGSSANTYFIFSDPLTTPTGEMDVGVAQLKTFTVQNNYMIQEVCLISNQGSDKYYCSAKKDTGTTDDSTPSRRIDVINVLFKRPNPDAIFTAYVDSGSGLTPVTPPSSFAFTTAYIQLKALNGDVRVVKVTVTGQVTVCAIGNVSGTGVTITRLKSGAATC